MNTKTVVQTATVVTTLLLAAPASSAEEQEITFHTFSIAAIDPRTGESGVAVTTRNGCVGNGVPWVRAGVGAVATQARTRTRYGNELLDLLEAGKSPAEALRQTTADDEGIENRQIGVIGIDGASAQHTGDEANDWAGHRAGDNYVTQGNLLVGERVIEAVSLSFESTEGRAMHLADRLIAALEAGQAAGGDARKGRMQSAAVIVADPREGNSRRTDRISTHINVCEHPTPVAELRRIYLSVSQTLGYRTLQRYSGQDVFQLKLMLHALGYYKKGANQLELTDDGAIVYDAETAAAVDTFRKDAGFNGSDRGSPIGYVDADTIDALWKRLEGAGKATSLRREILGLTRITR